MKTNKTIGFFGGSFSPPHYGHFLAACFAQKKYNLDEIWFCPTHKHAFEKSNMDFEFRISLCKALIENFESVFKVSDIESHPETDGKTYNTLKLLKKSYPNHQFKLIIGSDILDQTDQWYQFSSIEKEFGLGLIPREGYSKQAFVIPNFSSTEIRKLLELGDDQTLNNLMPSHVIKLLKKHS